MQYKQLHAEARLSRGFCIRSDKIRLGMGAKDTSLNFRIRSDLKKRLESIAASEGRSVAQICDAFLQAGLVAYDKEGTKYLRRFLARHLDPSKHE